jgi:hypothetical protein
MRRRTEVLLVVVGLAFSQGCGSCVGEATPTEKGPPPVSSLSPKAQKLLGTTAKENKGMTLDGTTAESMQKDQ